MCDTNAGNKEIAVVYKAGEQEIKLTPSIVQNYIVGANNGKITLQEFKMFTELCKVRHLNPFLQEAYCIKYSDNEPATIVVGKGAIEKRADRNPQYDGKESGIIVVGEDGKPIERKGCFYLPDEKVVGGWAYVYRKDRQHPTYCSVAIGEVAQRKKNGELNKNWANKPATMIEKVAKVRALREAFTEELDGMYEAEEMGVSLPADNVAPQPIQDEPVVVPQNDAFDDSGEVEKVDAEVVSMKDL